VAATTEAEPTFRRAVLLMTATSFLVPAAGVITAPILARALSADGRGELAAALAPAALALAVATLGLPDAVTFYLAKHPSFTRPALLWASLVTLGLSGLCMLGLVVALPFLSAGDPDLANLMVLAMAVTIPALIIGVFRGAAVGRQMWRTVAVERLINTSSRILAFGVLWLLGELTVFAAVLVSVVTPLISGLVYLRLLARPPADETESPLENGTIRPLLSFGSRVWLGSIASMLLSRSSQVLMVPLSSTADLGLYTVAMTISDMPLVVAMAVQGALFGVNSRTADSRQVTTTARLTLLAGIVGCTVLGGTLPFWIVPLFGAEFGAATVPTLMLMFSALLCIPGLMAATGLGAWGRPGLRSAGLAITLVVNVAVFVLLVPTLGVIGACWTSIASNVVLTTYMVLTASWVMKVPPADFVRLRGSDVSRGWQEAKRLVQRLCRRRPRTENPPEDRNK